MVGLFFLANCGVVRKTLEDDAKLSNSLSFIVDSFIYSRWFVKESVLESEIFVVDFFNMILIKNIFFVFRALTDFNLELVLFSLAVGWCDIVIIFFIIMSD